MYNYVNGPAGLNLDFQNRGTPINSYVNPMGSQNQFGAMPAPSPNPGKNNLLAGIGGIGMDTGTGITGYDKPPGMEENGGLMSSILGLAKGTFGNFDKDGKMTGLNMDSLMSTIGAIGSMWGAGQQLGLMKDSLNFQKDSFKTNTANQTKSYNTALEDRAKSRYSEDSPNQSKADDYIKRNRL